MSGTADFSRLRKALLRQGEPDRVPLAEITIDYAVRSAFLGRPLRTLADEAAFWLSAGYDYVPIRLGMQDLLKRSDPRETLVPVRGSSQPRLGALEGAQVRLWAEEGRGIIADLDDYRQFPWPRVEAVDYHPLDEVRAYLPPTARVIALVGWIFTPVWRLMGFESFCAALVDDPDLVQRLFDTIGEFEYRVLEQALRFDNVGAVWAADDVAYGQSLLVAPRYLRRFFFPWLRRLGDLCCRRGVPFIFHCDGNLSAVMEDVIACGVHALHPIEPKAMDIVQVKRQYGDRLAIIGNVDLIYTLTRGTPAEVTAEVQQRIAQLAPGGGYCLGSANSITDYVPLANFNAMREAAFQFGRYPIAGR